MCVRGCLHLQVFLHACTCRGFGRVPVYVHVYACIEKVDKVYNIEKVVSCSIYVVCVCVCVCVSRMQTTRTGFVTGMMSACTEAVQLLNFYYLMYCTGTWALLLPVQYCTCKHASILEATTSSD